MSKNIYLDKNQFVPNPKRNSYDKSKLVNGTYNAGFIYPIDWEEVTFGDSVKIDITAALRTMPMVWPIQTPVIAKFYSFYVRYRTLMKNFPDFRFNNKPVVHPFIAANSSADFWKTGELGDHLGVPTTYVAEHVFDSRSQFMDEDLFPSGVSVPRNYVLIPLEISSESAFTRIIGTAVSSYVPSGQPGEEFYGLRYYGSSVIKSDFSNGNNFLVPKNIFDNAIGINSQFYLVRFVRDNGHIVFESYTAVNVNDEHHIYNKLNTYSDTYYSFASNVGDVTTRYSIDVVDAYHGMAGYLKSLEDIESPYAPSKCESYFGIMDFSTENPCLNDTQFTYADVSTSNILFDTGSGMMELSDVQNPFAGSTPEIPLSALIPRAYEAIYRSHFQDLINEPFILNGEAQYNRYITEDGDGADTTDYKLFRRNWEADFLTSCKPSPQQGMAPIVGITSAGDITLIKGDGSEYTVHVNVDDNDLPASIDWASQTSEADSSVRRTLLDLATSGITINSLRNTNAFQKWLEANYRRGLKFRDQVLSNFGIKLEYKELDMPEFLGGFSIPLDVNTINQTSSSVEGSPLGDIAGNGGFFGRAKHSISHYCDEEGVVMTLMCITPIPVYSQLLSRCWLKQTPVDYYNPSFGKIGNQPVTYEEVCPIQAYNEGKDVHDVFGYQRPWYHMISSVDEVHGKMRNDMSGFLMQRIFGSTPELGAQFLHIDDSQLNDVFVAKSGVTDNYYGQISVKKYKKTCIPRYNLPSLT